MSNDKHMTSIESSTTRMLEIEAELADMKFKYLSEGISGERGRRAGLESELASIRLERHKEDIVRRQAKRAAQAFKGATFVDLLIEKIVACGHPEIVDAARSESRNAIEANGMLPAYQSR